MYKSDAKIEEMLDEIEHFITSSFVMGMKPKREKAIRDIYGNTYDIQLEIRSVLKLIDISHLLGANEIFLPYLCDEYGRLKAYCQILAEELKRMQPVKEHEDAIKRILSTFKPKDMVSMYYDDIKYINDVLSIEVDINESMAKVKAFEFSAEEKARINAQLDDYYPTGKSLRKKI